MVTDATGTPATPPKQDHEHLVALFEGAPRFLDRLERVGPYESTDLLFHVARDLAHSMPEDEQIEGPVEAAD